VLHISLGQQILEQIQRGCIQPLQVVEEQRERVFLARKHPNKAPENHLEAVLRILRRQVRDGRLCSDNELQLGDKIDDQLAVRTQRLLESVPPPAERCLALAQKRADEALEGLG
jgi:hypothetical protein